MDKKLFWIFSWVMTFLIGFAIGGIVCNWGFVKLSFWDVKITEVVQIFVIIIAATIVTYFINSRLSFTLKKRELIQNIINRFQNKIIEIFIIGDDYMKNKDNSKERVIKTSFKHASITLSIIQEIKGKYKLNELKEFNKSLKHNFFDFKASLTDTPFGNPNQNYSEADFIHFQELYQKLMNRLYRCKIELYS